MKKEVEELTSRQKQILIEVVDSYISTAEPVGSRTISRKSSLGVSSATIRNEMQDLEEMGYLYQPHTSAGRLPTLKGYRFFVQKLLEAKKRLLAEVNQVDLKLKDLQKKYKNQKKLLEELAKIVSSSLKNPSILAFSKKQEKIRKVSLVKLAPKLYLIIVVLSSGEIIKEKFSFEYQFSLEDLHEIETFLNNNFMDLPIQKLQVKIEEFKKSGLGNLENYRDYLQSMLDKLEKFLKMDSIEVKTLGKDNIFSIPEFREVEKIKNLLNYLESKELVSIFSENIDEFLIKIGLEEMKEKNLMDLSILGTYLPTLDSYIAIFGPLRMNYKKTLSYLMQLHDCWNK